MVGLLYHYRKIPGQNHLGNQDHRLYPLTWVISTLQEAIWWVCCSYERVHGPWACLTGTDLNQLPQETYLPMYVVRKEESTTTKLRVVFNASAKSSTGVSLNDSLLVGPTVHPPLINVLLWFRTHCVALTTDVSKIYRAIELVPADRDLHRIMWHNNLKHYRITQVTFGVSAS